MLIKFPKRIVNEILRIIRYELEFVNCLFLFITAVAIINPFTDVYSNGRAYFIIKTIVPEDILGIIILFLFLCSAFSLIDGGVKFRRNVLFAQATLWTLMFGVFVAANFGAVFPWWMAVLAICSILPAARMSDALDNLKT